MNGSWRILSRRPPPCAHRCSQTASPLLGHYSLARATIDDAFDVRSNQYAVGVAYARVRSRPASARPLESKQRNQRVGNHRSSIRDCRLRAAMPPIATRVNGLW